jgi:hypothetical protein
LRCDLDEVEVGFLGELQCLVGRDDSDGLPVWSHESDLGYPDPIVDSQLGADVSSIDQGVRKTTPKINNGFRFLLQAEASRDTYPSQVTGLRDRTRRPVLSFQRRSMRVGDVVLLISAWGSARPRTAELMVNHEC